MTRILQVLILVSLPWAAPSLDAQDATPDLTITAAVDRALGHYPTVGAARRLRDAAQAGLGVAKAARLPTLGLSASATQFQEPMIVTPIHGFTPGQTPPFDQTLIQGSATLSYTLFDGGARGARIGQARSEAEAADAALLASTQRLIERVVSTYADVLARVEILGAHDQRLAALAAERQRAGQLFEAGRGAEVMVLRADAALSEAQAVRVELASGLEISLRSLGRLIGAPGDRIEADRLAQVGLSDSTVPEREDAIAQAMAASPEVEGMKRRALAADAGTRVAKGARWPSLLLVGRFIDRGSSEGKYTGEWDAGVQLSYPLFTGGATSNRITQAQATAAAAGHELRLAQLDAAHQVDVALSAVQETLARVRSLGTAVAGFTEVARVEKLVLDTGAGTQTDYLQAEADLLSARADLAVARYGHLVARVQLARAMGSLSPGWLAENLETRP